PLEPRDHAGKGAHVFAEACDRGPRRNGPIAPARHDQLAAGAKFDRHRRTAGVAQLPSAPSRALRTGLPVILPNGPAQQVEADDVIAHVRTEVGSDRFCDLDSRKLNAALSDHLAGKRRSGDAARTSTVKKRLDLSVASHAFGKTSPTRALARTE